MQKNERGGMGVGGGNLEALDLPADASAVATPLLRDHEFREAVNELRDLARQYGGTAQLRERMAYWLRAFLGNLPAKAIAPLASGDEAADQQYRGGFLAGWAAAVAGDDAALRLAQNRAGSTASSASHDADDR